MWAEVGVEGWGKEGLRGMEEGSPLGSVMPNMLRRMCGCGGEEMRGEGKAGMRAEVDIDVADNLIDCC